jgi:putative heme iron utilization protein
LPGSLNLFQIKIFHKEINIIEARKSVFINRIEQYQKRELSLKIEREKFIIYSIDDRGIFHISSQEGKRI